MCVVYVHLYAPLHREIKSKIENIFVHNVHNTALYFVDFTDKRRLRLWNIGKWN